MTDTPCVLIDASHRGEIRFAITWPGRSQRLEEVRGYATEGMTTFTEALLRYERETGIRLRDHDGLAAVSGAVSGHAIPIARSRWTISRDGLAAIFKSAPVIINDVAARAWALRTTSPRADNLRGTSQPSLTNNTRHALLMVEEGLGCAVIDVDHLGIARILESEAGHLDFSPSNDDEDALLRAMRDATGGQPSWEQILLLERDDTVLRRAWPAMTETGRAQGIGALLGRFTANVILSAGAWNGVFISGRTASKVLAGPEGRAAFDASLSARRTFRRIIAAAPCWRIEQHEPVLTGGAALVAEQHLLRVAPAR